MKKNFNTIAKNVIKTEILSLKKLNKSFNNSFLKALDLINKCSGKLVLAGIGKSGLISRKISATLCSTGTPSFFLHPADSLHGDLGQITKQDILLILSYSGETEELKGILQYANRFGIKIIGAASKENSMLLKASNIKIILPKVTEAGIGSLVPTSSTTMMLAFGDALAVALMHKKKFSKAKFKIFHPSGSLGKKLITVGDLMLSGKKIPLIDENKKMKYAISFMSKKSLGCLIAINKKKIVSGFISDGDIRRKSKANIMEQKIKSVMTKKPIYISESMLAVKALNIMNKRKITTLIVSSEKDFKKKNGQFKAKGILHIHTLLTRGIK